MIGSENREYFRECFQKTVNYSRMKNREKFADDPHKIAHIHGFFLLAKP
jgi:hypothetical protein